MPKPQLSLEELSLFSEFLAYRRQLPASQERVHLKFWHPQGSHDDQLFALTLACYATKEKKSEGILAPAW